MSQTQRFKPTANQIRLAESVLVAMAHESTIRPIVEKYEQAILEKHQYQIASIWVEKGCSPQTILNRKRTYLLSEEDSQQYLAECHAARIAAGLKVSKPENCPLLEAEGLRIKAENALIQEMGKTPGLESLSKGVIDLELRNRALDLILKLLAPFVGDSVSILKRFTAKESSSD